MIIFETFPIKEVNHVLSSYAWVKLGLHVQMFYLGKMTKKINKYKITKLIKQKQSLLN